MGLSVSFAILGIVFIIAGIMWIIDSISFKANAVEITGKIVKIETYYEYENNGKRKEVEENHNVFVDYEYNGVYYDNVKIDYNVGMREGETITLLCDPKNPGDVRTSSDILLIPVLVLVLGLIAGCVGISKLVSEVKKNSSQKRLLSEGKILRAVVESIERNKSIRVNGRCPYIIYCTYTDEFNGNVYHFESDNIWGHQEMMFQVGSSINVHVDHNDYRKYYVNTEYSTSTNSGIVDFK